MSTNNEFFSDLSNSLKQALAIAKEQNKPSLKELLLSDTARTDELVPPRKQKNKHTS